MRLRSVCGVALLLIFSDVIAADKPALATDKPGELPDPLSLDQAIAFIDDSHPDLARAQIQIGRSSLDREQALSEKALTINAQGRLRWVEPPDDVLEQQHDDHLLALTAIKPLYDGGHSESLASAAIHQGEAASLQYTHTHDQHVIKVMRHFFDIIIADLRAGRDLEAMSVAFVRLDRAQDRHELGKISDIDVAELESTYQSARRQLYASEAEARSTRARLANALNRPGEQPSRLTPPDIPLGKVDLIDVEEIHKQVLAGNPALQASNASIEAARLRVKAARATSGPSINSVLQRSEYSRDTRTTDKWRVGLEFEWPIYDGGKSDIAMRRAQLAVTEAELNRRHMENRLRHDVGQLVDHVRTLKAQGDAANAYIEFRELYLDRSRALYEMEVKTDLGDSMVEISESQVRTAQQRFQLLLTLAQLNALAGKPVNNWHALAKADAGENTNVQEAASENQSNP